MPTAEASGAIASFDDGADGLPVVDLTVSIEPVQAGSGDPSPSNVRPITGWTGCNVVVSPTNSAQDGTTYNISFGSAGTVYGGSLDVPSGVLTVTHTLWSTNGRPASDPTAVSTSNDITQFWLYAGGTNRTYFNGVKCDSLINNQSGGISNTFRAISTYQSSINIYMPTSLAGTTRASINTYLNAHPMNFWVQLITPVTYQLTPTEVTTLLGQNNIWADTGDVDVVYWKDSVISGIAARYYTRTETDALLAGKADTADLGALAGKDQAAWDTDISGKPSTFPPSSHNHDERYYTESETDTLLAAKANTADLGALAGKDQAAWDTDISGKPSTFPPSSHNHDERYYTESEVDTKLSARDILYFASQAVSAASSAEIMRITDSAITADTVVLECTFQKADRILGSVSWTSYAGYISFSGTCTAATTANVTLAKKSN